MTRALLSQVAGLCLAITLAPPALAQDLAAAEALFREGRALLDAGQTDAACPKLAESQRLDPSSGTLLNLAACHLKQGRTATAWAEFLAAARIASAQGKADRVTEARQRAAELEPALSYLTIVVQAPVPGLEVRRDDVKLEASSLGSKIPTDPGKHVLLVSAPGHESMSFEVSVGASKDVQTVTVPALKAQAAPPPEPPTRAEKDAFRRQEPPPGDSPGSDPGVLDDGSGQRTLGFVVGGVGAGALVVGTVFGVLALSAYGEADDACPRHSDCDGDAMDLRDGADLRANIANVGVGLGVVGLGVGAVLVLTAGPGEKAAATPGARRGFAVLPAAGPHGGGVLFSGVL